MPRNRLPQLRAGRATAHSASNRHRAPSYRPPQCARASENPARRSPDGSHHAPALPMRERASAHRTRIPRRSATFCQPVSYEVDAHSPIRDTQRIHCTGRFDQASMASATRRLRRDEQRRDQRNAIFASFLGWTFDAFDFFVLTFLIADIGKAFGKSRPEVALTLTLTLAMRPVGALIFGMMDDRYGRRLPMTINIVFYGVMSVSGPRAHVSGVPDSAHAVRHRHGRAVGRKLFAGARSHLPALARRALGPAASGLLARKSARRLPSSTPTRPCNTLTRSMHGAPCSFSADCPRCFPSSCSRA